MYSLHASVIDRISHLLRILYLIVVLLCMYSRCYACHGAMSFVPIVCELPCYCHQLRGQCCQGFEHHPSMGLASLWMPSHTQCHEGGARWLEEPCRQSHTNHGSVIIGGVGQVSGTIFSLHCCANDLHVVLEEHVCNVLHPCLCSSYVYIWQGAWTNVPNSGFPH